MKIGVTASAFDLLHSGHVTMLKEGKTQCEWLIALLHTNPQIDRPEKNKPIQSTLERWIQLEGCRYVDDIIPYDTEQDLLNILNILSPDVRIIGEEYEGKEFTGKHLGIPIYYNKRQHDYSSTELRNRLINSVKL